MRRFGPTILSLLVLASAASAAHPSPDQMARVKSLADDMDEAMEYVQREMKDYAASGELSRWEDIAVRRLRILASRSDDFEEKARDFAHDPAATVADFRMLLGAFDRAMETSAWMSYRDDIRERFRRVQAAVEDLAEYYGGYPEYGSPEYLEMVESVDTDLGAEPLPAEPLRAEPIAPRAESRARVVHLADAADEALEEIRQKMAEYSRSPDLSRWERIAFRRLDELAQRADAFEEAARDNELSAAATATEFRQLLGAYVAVMQSAGWLHSRGTVRQDFRRLGVAMDELVELYGGYPAFGSREWREVQLGRRG